MCRTSAVQGPESRQTLPGNYKGKTKDRRKVYEAKALRSLKTLRFLTRENCYACSNYKTLLRITNR
jgi:hypothetical protein